MSRRVSAVVLGVGLLGLAVSVPRAGGQAGPPADKVTFRASDGKVTTEVGQVKDSARGVELQLSKGSKLIPAQNIVRVEYGALPSVAGNDLLSARGQDDGKDTQRAQAAFAALLAKAGPSAPERTLRHLTYREAAAAARGADARTGADFAPAAKAAAAKLVAAGKLANKSWEAWPAHRTAARLQAEAGDPATAGATLAALAAVPDLAKDQKQDALLASAAYYLFAKQPTQATAAVTSAEAGGVADAHRERVAVLKAAAGGAAGLQKAVDGATDPAAKGLGYALLGSALADANKPREAMWAYLWADVVYAQDTDAQVFALHRLIELFEKQGEKDRADQFREKLPRARAAG